MMSSGSERLIHTAGSIHVTHGGPEIQSSLSHWQNLDEEKRKMTRKKQSELQMVLSVLTCLHSLPHNFFELKFCLYTKSGCSVIDKKSQRCLRSVELRKQPLKVQTIMQLVQRPRLGQG